MKKILLFLLIGMFCINFISATIWNTFTTGLTEENLTFSGTESIIRNLSVPNGTYFTNASITLTGYQDGSGDYPVNVSLSIGGTNLWNGTMVGNYSNASAYWDFNTTDIFDLLGRNNGTNSGTAVTTGIIENGLDFEASEGDFILIDNLTGYALNTSGSISLWIKPESFNSTTQFIFNHQTGGSANDRLSLILDGDEGGLKFIFMDDPNPVGYNSTYLNGSWFHVVSTWNSSGYYDLWVNGVKRNSSTGATIIPFGDDNFTIGKAHAGATRNYDGVMDEFVFWQKQLSQSEIEGIYNHGSGTPYGELQGFQSSETLDLIENLNDYITTCTAVSGNCTIPFNFTSTNGNLSYSDLAFSNEGFLENSQTFNTSAYETDSQTFVLNSSFDTSLYTTASAILNYNGTAYAGTTDCVGSICISTATIDIPLITEGSGSENKTFYWTLTLFGSSSNSSTSNSTTQTQTVNEINMSYCASGSIAINFNIFNESDQSSLVADFDGSFNYWLGGGDVYRNESVDINASTISLCVNNEEFFITNSTIALMENGYSTRRYDFINENYTNVSITNKSLYLLNSVSSSNIIIEVKDEGLQPLEGILVVIEKFLTDENKYIEVESQLTDEFGQFTAKLEENDVKYRFRFYSSIGTLLKTSQDIRIICRATICVLPFVIETDVDVFDDFEEIPLFTSELSFDNSTNTFIYSWDDRTTSDITIRLEVYRYRLNESVLVCNSTSTSSVSTLTCSVGSDRATYKAQAFRSVDEGREIRIAILSYKVGDPYSTYGVEGLLWVFILAFTCLGIGAYNPTIAISLYGIVFIFMGILGIISVPIEVFFANTIICIIAIWGLSR